MVKLTVVPVIPLALSEAMKAATLAMSASGHDPSRVGRAGEVPLELFPGHAQCLGLGVEDFLSSCLSPACRVVADRPRECPEVRARRIDLE